jgi:hypothetical protein
MERNQSEWVQLFGAKMRAERAPRVNDPLPTPIVEMLRAIEDAERQLRVRESERTSPER